MRVSRVLSLMALAASADAANIDSGFAQDGVTTYCQGVKGDVGKFDFSKLEPSSVGKCPIEVLVFPAIRTAKPLEPIEVGWRAHAKDGTGENLFPRAVDPNTHKAQDVVASFIRVCKAGTNCQDAKDGDMIGPPEFATGPFGADGNHEMRKAKFLIKEPGDYVIVGMVVLPGDGQLDISATQFVSFTKVSIVDPNGKPSPSPGASPSATPGVSTGTPSKSPSSTPAKSQTPGPSGPNSPSGSKSNGNGSNGDKANGDTANGDKSSGDKSSGGKTEDPAAKPGSSSSKSDSGSDTVDLKNIDFNKLRRGTAPPSTDSKDPSALGGDVPASGPATGSKKDGSGDAPTMDAKNKEGNKGFMQSNSLLMIGVFAACMLVGIAGFMTVTKKKSDLAATSNQDKAFGHRRVDSDVDSNIQRSTEGSAHSHDSSRSDRSKSRLSGYDADALLRSSERPPSHSSSHHNSHNAGAGQPSDIRESELSELSDHLSEISSLASEAYTGTGPIFDNSIHDSQLSFDTKSFQWKPSEYGDSMMESKNSLMDSERDFSIDEGDSEYESSRYMSEISEDSYMARDTRGSVGDSYASRVSGSTGYSMASYHSSQSGTSYNSSHSGGRSTSTSDMSYSSAKYDVYDQSLPQF